MDVSEHLNVRASDCAARDVGVDFVIDVDLEGWEESAHAVAVAVAAADGDTLVGTEA